MAASMLSSYIVSGTSFVDDLQANYLKFLLRMANHESFTIEEAAKVAGVGDRATRTMLATLRALDLVEVVEDGGGRHKKRRYRCTKQLYVGDKMAS